MFEWRDSDLQTLSYSEYNRYPEFQPNPSENKSVEKGMLHFKGPKITFPHLASDQQASCTNALR